MKGLMMDSSLSISGILTHAETIHPKSKIVSRNVTGDIHQYTYGEAANRSRQLANALVRFGVEQGDRVATLAWNTHRHYELYFAVSGSGAILHTVNPRLFPRQLIYIINHAEDEVLFVDLTFVPIIEEIYGSLKTLKHIVVLTDEANMPESSNLKLLCYETLIADESTTFEWPAVDENSAASLCYTSGTTGNPKGALYSHRSTVLHAWACCGSDAFGIANRTTVMPVVPMFHVNAWGVPYAATMSGAALVLPGAGMDGESLYEIISSAGVDLMLGVPTVWLGLLNYCADQSLKLTSVKTVVVGGAAAPLSMIEAFHTEHDAFVMHAWGMTEISPVGSVNSMNQYTASLSLEQRFQVQTKQGRPIFGIEMEIVDANGQPLPHDGKASGRLLVRGPWVAKSYYKDEDTSAWSNGWFDTGDVATLDPMGYMNIVDRAKDMIKSGGEWISSIDLENAATGHEAVMECAVIGVPHPKWDERPLLLVVLKEGKKTTKESVLAFLADKVAKWWLPDDVIFVDTLPHTATGKLLKMKLREQYSDRLTD
ncbi:MAG: long-chain fatty acid--CoA ligase [Gammaproteobacteria bacterium]|nr:MAG: long-chain fatty acid--CoA ligase [Gammaproteobacteria bacterium]